jgi:hypothetical protein
VSSSTAAGAAERTDPSAGRARETPRPLGLLMLLAVALPVLTSVAVWGATDPGPRWQAEYFRGRELSGPARVELARDAALHVWRQDPMPELEAGQYSVRWQTCLRADAARAVAFMLSSDDSSRAFLDSGPLIDNWGEHTRATKSAAVTLQPGWHHLVVEFAPARRHARVGLLASFDGELPESIDPERLRLPERGPMPCRVGD